MNRPGPHYHMIVHALQKLLHLNKKYLSDLQIPRTCKKTLFQMEYPVCKACIINNNGRAGRIAPSPLYFMLLALNETPEFPLWDLNICVDFHLRFKKIKNLKKLNEILISTKLHNPIRDTRVQKLVFKTILLSSENIRFLNMPNWFGKQFKKYEFLSAQRS